ncbi:TIGR02594 family protein [Bradyrhizobium sp.]|uniref:TIGR02594 family protein n=1 Tax=Bradyrhizobium sp. TaxID=376 RepID=UPI003BB16228
MLEFSFSAFRRPLVGLALLSAAVAASASPASARSRHHVYRYTHAHMAYHYVRRHFAQPQYFAQPQFFAQPWDPQVASHPQVAYRQRVGRSVALTRLRRLADTQASGTPYGSGGGTAMSGASSTLVMEARHYLGGNPTGRGSLWCARFMNMVLEHTGHRGTGSDMASSFAHYGQRISGPQVGAIAVMGRRGGGHVGIITGIDAQGNPIMISGNNGNRVREAPVSRGRIYAYVMTN